MDAIPSIPSFYSNQLIFITGATGFMGKVLIEKLLRSCPDIEKIYILVRSKKDKSAEERWKDAAKMEVFDRLKKERPGSLEKKIEVISGDVKEKKLGISQESRQILEENITMVFHCAASVRFNDPLPEAVFLNLRGSHEVVKLALGMAKLKIFLHVSTTYCNNESTTSGETMYSCPADWRKMIEVSEKLDPRDVAILSTKYMESFPNTYTFTKNLTERLMWDYCDKLPIVIVRPSIVICSLYEPFPAWIDNLYGPIGLMYGVAKGVVRTVYCDKDTIPDYMAVDIAIKVLIIAAWKKGQNPVTGNIDIYNAASSSKGITNAEMMKIADKVSLENPLSEVLWYPNYTVTKCRANFKMQAIFKHLLPAVIVDYMLKLAGKKPLLLETQIRIYNAMMALGYFATKSWKFSNENFLNIKNTLLEEDRRDFYFEYDHIQPEEFISNSIKLGKRILLNEDDSLLPQTKKKMKRLYWIDKIVSVSTIFLIFFATYKYLF